MRGMGITVSSAAGRLAAAAISLSLTGTPAIAAVSDPRVDAQIGDIEIVNDGTDNAIYVRGTFSPALPCPVQGFVYFSSDPYQKEVTALLLTAKAAGRTISFVHVYCITSGAPTGYARGNGYVLK